MNGRKDIEMNVQDEKCVIIVDEGMEIGVIANVTAILAISLGKLRPDISGEDTVDADNHTHFGLIQVPVPVLKASAEKVAEIRNKLFEEGFEDISCIDFTNVAQECMTYADYTDTMKQSTKDDLVYMGIAMVGSKKKVNKLTGSLGLLR